MIEQILEVVKSLRQVFLFFAKKEIKSLVSKK